MTTAPKKPIYDPAKTYEDNFDNGPFGAFSKPLRYRDQGKPQYSFLGYPVYSPFGIAAGPLINSNYVIAALRKGFDIVCYKTQRSVAFKCNAFPNVIYVDVDGDLTLEKASLPLVGKQSTKRDAASLTITNSFGNPSKGPAFWVEDLQKALKAEREGQLVVMSVVGTIQPGFTDIDYFDDFALAAGLAVAAGAKAIEVNLSCPNVANEGVLCYTPESVEAICRKVSQAIGNVPLIAKIGYYSGGQQQLLKRVVEAMAPYVAAVSSINTIAASVVDTAGKQALPGPNRLKSGLCGASIKWAGIDMTKRLADLRKALGLDYEIIGVGGVMGVKDFQDYRLAGADVVQSATGAMWNPELAAEIKASLNG